MGQLFYNLAGFAGAFLMFSGILAITVCVSAYLLPSSLNINATKVAAAAAAAAGKPGAPPVQPVTYG